MLSQHVSRFAAIAALLAVCPTGISGGVQLLSKDDLKLIERSRGMMGRTVHNVRHSLNRSNAGRIGGAMKKRKAKWYARTRGCRLSAR
jgi:hypothetical protein